jgi:hypothetical protein
MAFSVTNFKEALQFGGARPNLFEVSISFPAVAGVKNSSQLTFMCKAASIPGEDIQPITVGYFGRQIKLPGDRVFPEWQIVIINDEDWTLRSAFETWSNKMNGHVNNKRDPNAMPNINTVDAGYEVDAKVSQFGKRGDLISTYSMIGAWPSMVAPMDVKWEENNTIQEFGVTFQYQWWTSTKTPASSAGDGSTVTVTI